MRSHPEANVELGAALAIDIGQSCPLDGAFQDPELVAEGKALHSQQASGSEEDASGKDQGLEEVEHVQAVWPGCAQPSTFTH